MTTKVLLISLSSTQHNQTFFDYYEPLALAVLKGHLLSSFGKKLEVFNVDMQHDEYCSLKNLIKLINNIKPNIIGLSVPWGTLNILDNLIKKIFKDGVLNCRPVVILGKQLPSNFPEKIIERYVEYPILINIGPGEIALEDLVKNPKKLKNIRNIVYEQKDKIRYNSISNDYIVKYPAWHENLDRYNIIAMQTSRGCSWSRCSFCLRLKNNKRSSCQWTPISPTVVIKEIIKLSSMGVKGINIIDENFIGGIEGLSHAKKIIEKIKYNKEINKIDKKFVFSISIRVDEILLLDKEGLIKSFKEAGLCFCFVGVESCSSSQLKRYRKGFNTDSIIKAIKILKKNKIFFEAGFILFDPLVSLSELQENAEMMRYKFKDNTKLVDFIANPLNRGRIFYKSLLYYQIKNNYPKLLKKLDINKGQYDYLFLDNKAQKIMEIIERWYPDNLHNTFIKPIRHIIMHSIHNLQNKDTYNALQKYISGFRRLELDFLTKIVVLHKKESLKREINETIRLFSKKIDHYIFKIKIDTLKLPLVYMEVIKEVISNIER